MWKKYKKNVPVEAKKFNAERWIYEGVGAYPMVATRHNDDPNFKGSLGKYFRYEPVINTLESDMLVSDGDFIIKGSQDEYWPCKAEIFEETYVACD